MPVAPAPAAGHRAAPPRMTRPRHPIAEITSAHTRPRLEGLDLARWLAVTGMLTVHFTVPFLEPGTVTGVLIHKAAWGRSTILFTFLAGVSLALVSGAGSPHRGARGNVTAGRITVRGLLLMGIGWALTAVVAPTEAALTVILTYYGLYFLLVLPFLRLNARWSAATAVAAVLVGPQLLFVLRRSHAAGGWFHDFTEAWNRFSLGHIFLDQGLLDLAVHGFYPALSYIAVVLAGVAVGRSNLHSHTVRMGLAALGLFLNSVAYRGSWHAWESYSLVVALGNRDRVQGPIPTDDARWLLTSASHTATTPEILGGTGLALFVFVVCLYAAEHLPRLLAPLTAAGTMALTIYALHALAMAWQADLGPYLDDREWLFNEYMAELFIVGSVVVAFAWRRLIGRGPLEAFVSTVSKVLVPAPRHERR